MASVSIIPFCHSRFTYFTVVTLALSHALSPQKHIELGSVNLEAGSTQWFDLEPEERFDS